MAIRLRAPHGRDPRELAAMDVDTHLDDASLKRKYVHAMFDVVAPGYDAFVRLLSLGRDQLWKARLAEQAARHASDNPVVLDLACGTGDLAAALARRFGAGRVLGFDLSTPMLREARRRISALGFVACDMLQLCLADHSVNIVTVGYGLRNAPDLRQALDEISRVLKPGGILLTLDLYRPAGKLWRGLFVWYLGLVGRIGGWLWHREPMAYGYLAPSVQRYHTISQFEEVLAAAGWTIEWRDTPLGGGVGLHVARRLARV